MSRQSGKKHDRGTNVAGHLERESDLGNAEVAELDRKPLIRTNGGKSYQLQGT